MKGQTRIFEEVLLFAISIAIFVTCLSIFQMYQNHFGYVSLEDQTREIGNIVQGHLMEISRLRGMDASVVVSVPREISGEYYVISLSDTEITVVTERTAMKYTGTLNMISRDLGGNIDGLSGQANSGKGQIIIYKRGNNIILE
jgi:hypothetical protein